MSQLYDLAACDNCCPQLKTICVAKGEGETFFWTFKDANGEPLSLIGYNFRQQFRTAVGGLLLTFDTANMTITAGLVTVILTAAQSLTMTTGNPAYVTDLLVTPPTGQPYVVPVQFQLNVYTPASLAA